MMDVKVQCKSFVLLLCLFSATKALTGEVNSSRKPCVPKYFGRGASVCVCNATYCDDVEANVPLTKGMFATYTTSIDGQRLEKKIHKIQYAETPKENVRSSYLAVTIDRETTYQTILGFGGAFTDATGINIASLSEAAGRNLLASYFSPSGLQYTIGRIPMASCDFSTRVYSYDDVPGDLNLTHFALAPEDFKYKINYIQAAKKMSNRPIKFFGSPWSSPGWMKETGKMPGGGFLIGKPGGEYYQSWAHYFVRFLQEYAKQNVSIWGVTAQNEPSTGYEPDYAFQTLAFSPKLQRDFIAKDLGPALEKNGFGHVKLMVLDDQRVSLPLWPSVIMQSPEASKYVSGVAVHWYADKIIPPFVLSLTHDAMPDKFILYTEACAGFQAWLNVTPVMLGEWDRFDDYVKDIMDDLAHWVSGWTDWNMALDMEGGPNWVKNFVDSPVIVNKEKDEFYKQPMFYGLGHFSKFLPPGCVRIRLLIDEEVNCSLQILGFSCPDKSTVVQIYNSATTEHSFSIKDPERGVISGVAPRKSQMTVIWW